MNRSPLGLVVHLEVQAEKLAEFLVEISNNAENTRREPGCVRFDVLQSKDDKHKFMLYEIYKDDAGLEVLHL
jgi:autoinducer 2-degrading protein